VELVGLKLGKLLEYTRRRYRAGLLLHHQIDKLQALNVCWNPSTIRTGCLVKTFDFIVEGLKIYKRLHEGNVLVPKSFVVPKEEDNSNWSKELIGFPLGMHINVARRFYRHNLLSATQINILNDIGMIWDPLNRRTPFNEKELADLSRGLETFYKLLGHRIVPLGFKPSRIMGWPEMDLALGKLVKKARNLYKRNVLSPEIIQTLTDQGMVWHMTTSDITFVKKSFHVYKNKYLTAAAALDVTDDSDVV
jgi:hypothetical protein